MSIEEKAQQHAVENQIEASKLAGFDELLKLEDKLIEAGVPAFSAIRLVTSVSIWLCQMLDYS